MIVWSTAGCVSRCSNVYRSKLAALVAVFGRCLATRRELVRDNFRVANRHDHCRANLKNHVPVVSGIDDGSGTTDILVTASSWQVPAFGVCPKCAREILDGWRVCSACAAQSDRPRPRDHRRASTQRTSV